MRRQFRLPSEEESHLTSLDLPWETLLDGGSQWILIHDRPVPAGYMHDRVSTALLVPAGYPDTQFDMVYFKPALALQDGRAIGALASQVIDGQTWQRWSRHRTAQNPWRPGVDDVAGHLVLVDHWLERELAKGLA